MKITVPVTKEVDVEPLILEIAREHFKDTKIESVDVREDYDHVGQKILRVDILYSTENGPMDPALRVRFRCRLIPMLEEIGIHSFPHMEFMTKQGLKEIADASP